MDIQLEKKKGLQKKHIPYVAGGVLFVILLGWIIFGDHASFFRVPHQSQNDGEHPSVTCQPAFPNLEYFNRMGAIIVPFIKQTVPQTGANDRTDYAIDKKLVHPLFRILLFFE